MSIPLVDVRAQYAPVLGELKERIGEVLESGRFILGPNVTAFEEEAADYLGVAATVGVANGTDALVLVLDALEIGPGDEVICPAFTFYATAEAIVRRGATPVFCDIDPVTLDLDPADVAARVTERTRAILAVHLFGRPAPLGELPAGVPVIEDAAQAFGATFSPTTETKTPTTHPLTPRTGLSPLGRAYRRVGSVGVAGTFSFFPTKNLFGLGDGGLVATSEAPLADTLRALRFHGSRDGKITFELIGYNSRLDEIQAAALRLFLRELDGWNAARREAAARYAELGLGEMCELPEDDLGHVYHMYVVKTRERDRFAEALRAEGIGCASYYTTPLHLQPALAYLGYQEGSLPETERAAAENLAIPMWAGITPEQQQRVVGTIRSAATVATPS